MSYLEAARDALRKVGVPEHDLDWCIALALGESDIEAALETLKHDKTVISVGYQFGSRKLTDVQLGALKIIYGRYGLEAAEVATEIALLLSLEKSA